MATRNDRFQVTFEVQGDGKLKAALADIGRDGGRAAEGLDKAATAQQRMQVAAVRAVAVLGGGLVTAMGLVIKNTMEAERVNAQLDATLETLGNRAAVSRTQIAAMVDQLQKTTTFDDEGLTQAADALLKFTNIDTSNFGAALEMATDLSAKMGTDLVDAANSVGKALNNPETAMRLLRDMGVQLSDEQQKLVKHLMETGQTASAQALILRELERRYGEAAEAARGTLAGALQALKNTLGNLTEGGDGSLNGVTQSINNLIDTLNDPDVKAGFATIINGLIGTANYAIKTASALGNATAALHEYFSENAKKSTQSLENRRTDLETELFGEQRAQRRSWLGSAAAQNAPRVVELKAEIAEIDKLLAQRRAQAIAEQSASGGRSPGRFSDDYERASLGFNPNPRSGGGAGAGTGGGRAVSAAIDEEAEARKRLTEAILSQITQNEREIALMGIDKSRREELTALYDVQHGKLRNATQAEKDAYVENARALDLARETNEAREESNRLLEQEAQARADVQDGLQQILQDQMFELDLLKKTRAERALALAERQAGGSFSEADRAQFLSNEEALRAASEMQGYVDDTKDVLHGFFMDMSKDARGTFSNIGDYFDQLIDRILDRWLTSQIDKLFDGMGNGGSGGGGDFFSGLLGMFGFGGGGSSGGSSGGGASIVSWALGGYARGGYTGDGPEDEIAGVVHRGEYVVPASVVRAIRGAPMAKPSSMPSGSGGSGGNTFVTHIGIRGDVTARTADQMAGRMAEKLQRQARNR